MNSVKLAQFWAISGFTTILGYAIFRLFGHFLISWQMEYQWYHWFILILNIAFMAYSEGYKGFQKSYSLKFAKRLQELEQKPSFINKLLAPFFCMNYFSAEKKNLITAYILTIAIILLIIIFNHIPQPWRGILDIGVVVGLSWGILATLMISINRLNKN